MIASFLVFSHRDYCGIWKGSIAIAIAVVIDVDIDTATITYYFLSKRRSQMMPLE